MSDIDPSLTPSAVPSPEARSFLGALQTSELRIFEPRDCTPEIFSKDFLAETALSDNESVQTAERVLQAIPDMAAVLRGDAEPSPNTLPAVEAFAALRPVYVHLEDALLSDDVLLAKDAFSAEDAGLILHPNFVGHPMFGSKFLVFPGIEKEGRHYRLMQRRIDPEDSAREEVMRRALGFLTFHSDVKKTGEVLQAVVEYEEDAEIPHQITTRELLDWQHRVRRAQVSLSLDIGPEDESLDNLLRHDGRLYWCDGDILSAEPIDPQDVSKEIERHRNALVRFIRK